jgi:hypothetical protein
VALAVALAMALDGAALDGAVRTGVHGVDGTSLRLATEGEGGVGGIGSDVCEIILISLNIFILIFVNLTVKCKIGKCETGNLRIGKMVKNKKKLSTTKL